MKLILASKEKYLLEKGYDLLGIPRENLKIGLIDTAFKASEDQDFIKYMDEYLELMRNSGIDFKKFDIKDKTKEEIINFFSDRNVIQVCGGNPFYLLKVVMETGFDLILKNLLEKGLSYIGCSSGASLVSPTMEVGAWKINRNKYGLTDFTALNYVPFLIKCHYVDDKKDEIIERIKKLKYPLKILKDDQLLYIENDNIRFIGNSEEVVL